MSIVKTKLKNARDYLGKKKYDSAKDAALQVLDYEPDNYNANVFLGLASLELGDLDESEKAYRRATELNPDQLLAWQGLSQFYQRKSDWDNYADVLFDLMKIYAQSQDALKCAETLQKYIDIRRQHGNTGQVIEALSFLLPSSPFYTLLSTLPTPDPTSPTSTTTFAIQSSIHNGLAVLEELINIVERQETELFEKELKKRRTRLGAPGLDQIKKEVGTEIWSSSQLPGLYNEILNHPNTSDNLRREIESKLLRYKVKLLHALPTTADVATVKNKIREEITDLISGAVLLKLPDELAWTLFIEGKDVETISEYDYGLWRQFINLFPHSHLSSVFRGYLIYMQLPLSDDDDSDDVNTSEKGAPEAADIGYDMIMEACEFMPSSILATRILADVQFRELEYSNAIQAAENGIQLLNKYETNAGTTFVLVRLGFNVILTCSLVHLFPPKHHRRALSIANEVLATSPDNIPGLMARAYVLQASNKWSDAGQLFARVNQISPGNVDEGLRAKEELAWCQIRDGHLADGTQQLEEVLQTLSDLKGREKDRARCHWRLGQAIWNSDVYGKAQDAYQNFINALKCDANFAPAFTSLGVYYADFAGDHTRASKCFQKAFELDSREADAAHRLAKGFADEQEWDLVEIIARRTIEGEGGLEGGMAGNTSEKFSPTNTWAWKALGVVHFINRDYISAISAFQVALRAEPEDSLIWLRLGEAYFKSGRHSAALKAFDRANLLRPNDWICSFFIAEVHRQLGQFQEAISRLEAIMVERSSEICVLASLAQTHLDLGCSEISTGFTTRAEKSWVSALRFAYAAIKLSTGFRAVIWKIVADAVLHLSSLALLSNESDFGILVDICDLLPSTPSDRISEVVPTLPRQLKQVPGPSPNELVQLSIHIYDHRISLGSSESAATSSAWFDLAMSLRHSAALSSYSEVKEKAETQAVKCLTEAVRNSPTNPSYWVALGDAYFTLQPKMAQHAYIKALEIDSKNAATWTNLGLLFFHHNDHDLANEALYRAQSADPDYTLAWLGQALVAINQGHDTGATGILAHAVGLSNSVPEADYQYGLKIFAKYQVIHPILPAHNLMPAFFVLDRYCKSCSKDPSALHLYGLVCETLGQTQLGIELISKAISMLEAVYEETEDSEIERQFSIAHSNAGRLKLALNDYSGALESFETVLGLLPENGDVIDNQGAVLRTHVQFGAGLVHFRQGNLENALEMLEASLETAKNESVKGEVQVLLAQVLWAIGTEESQELAKTNLLQCISTNPENLTAINVLAAMGILTNDDSLVDAALSEILSLSADRRLELDPQRDVNHLLVQHHLSQDDSHRALSVAQQAIFADPVEPETRNQLAKLMLQTKQYSSVLPVLSGIASDLDDPENARRNSNLKAIAEAFVSSDSGRAVHLAQRGIMMKPSDFEGWLAVAFARSRIQT